MLNNSRLLYYVLRQKSLLVRGIFFDILLHCNDNKFSELIQIGIGSAL